ncbi:MAG: hypothetical protein AAFU65_07805, partial [Pseudomonadota bacterium]
WLLIRIGVLVFCYLMLVGGALFGFAFLSEKLRTGAVTYGGAEHTDTAAFAQAVGWPLGVALLGLAGIVLLKRLDRARSAADD